MSNDSFSSSPHVDATDSPPDSLLIDRYLTGECTLPERVSMDRWLLANPSWRDTMDTMRRYGDFRRSHSNLHIDEERAEQRLLARIGVEINHVKWLDSRALPTKLLSHTDAKRWYHAAAFAGIRGQSRIGWFASGAVLAVASAVLLMVQSSPRASSVENSQSQTYTTGIGQVAQLTLDDGTRVTLSPQSIMRVAAFNTHERRITLSGEADFDVVQSAAAPFVVRTRDLVAKVLGTTFKVTNYDETSDARIAVTTGKVVVSSEAWHASKLMRDVTLTSGRMAILGDSGRLIESPIIHGVDRINGQLLFRDVPVDVVLTTLARWYDYEFKAAERDFTKETLTASLSTISLENALKTLELYLGAEVTIHGKIVTVRRHRESGNANAARYPSEYAYSKIYSKGVSR